MSPEFLITTYYASLLLCKTAKTSGISMKSMIPARSVIVLGDSLCRLNGDDRSRISPSLSKLFYHLFYIDFTIFRTLYLATPLLFFSEYLWLLFFVLEEIQTPSTFKFLITRSLEVQWAFNNLLCILFNQKGKKDTIHNKS